MQELAMCVRNTGIKGSECSAVSFYAAILLVPRPLTVNHLNHVLPDNPRELWFVFSRAFFIPSRYYRQEKTLMLRRSLLVPDMSRPNVYDHGKQKQRWKWYIWACCQSVVRSSEQQVFFAAGFQRGNWRSQYQRRRPLEIWGDIPLQEILKIK